MLAASTPEKEVERLGRLAREQSLVDLVPCLFEGDRARGLLVFDLDDVPPESRAHWLAHIPGLHREGRIREGLDHTVGLKITEVPTLRGCRPLGVLPGELCEVCAGLPRLLRDALGCLASLFDL